MNCSLSLSAALLLALCCLAKVSDSLSFERQNGTRREEMKSRRETPCLNCYNSNRDDDGTEGMSELMEAVLEESTDEERAMVVINRAKVDAFLANNDYTKTTGEFISTGFTSLSKLIYMDYKQEPAALVKSIGDALVPIIALGLALIPGVGPIIAGIFTGLWALFSPLIYQDESAESKMEKMINEAIEKAHKVTDAKLAKLLTGSIRGELNRNQYVCDKYSVVATNFSKNWNMTGSVNETFRLELITFLDACDDFLKDTAEAFDHPDFADALWMSSAMTTLTRTSFLTDVINYANILRLPDKFIENYFREMKADIKRHFKLHAQGMTQRMKTIEESKGLRAEEVSSCKMQSELLFLDRSLYPYGVPKEFVNHDNKLSITADDFTMTTENGRGKKEFEHIQVAFDATNDVGWISAKTLLNCYMGLTIQNIPTNTDFIVASIQFIPNYSYNIRVLYLTYQRKLTTGENSNVTELNSRNKKVKAKLVDTSDNKILVKIEEVQDQDGHHVLFETDATYIFPKCDVLPVSEEHEFQPCLTYRTEEAYEGKFVIDDVDTFNLKEESDSRVEGSIRVTAQDWKLYFVAVELIVRQIIE